jgi:DeoR family transcriptional regulator, aga operon transcriptional repressor
MLRETMREPSLESSQGREAAAKADIAQRAAQLVSSGDSVFLDVGSTALALATALVERTELHDVVVATNGLSIALALEQALPRFSVVVTGGTLRPLQHSLVNPGVTLTLESMRFDLAFIGCNGVHAQNGVTNVNLPETEIKRQVIRAARRRVLVADSSKLGVTEVGVVGPLSDFATLVTAGDVAQSVVDELMAAGLRIDLATRTLENV